MRILFYSLLVKKVNCSGVMSKKIDYKGLCCTNLSVKAFSAI